LLNNLGMANLGTLGAQGNGVHIFVVNNLFDGHDGLVGEGLVFEHFFGTGNQRRSLMWTKRRKESKERVWNLQNANSSRVRPAVSGKKNHTKTISNASQQQ
jgi:hypothetical protein